jgi:hypothetical protein
MTATVSQLFAADLSEPEATRLHRDLEVYRAYLAGPCPDDCPNADDGPMHREYTPYYEGNRNVIVALNAILTGDFDCDVWASITLTIDPDES